jgi:hypothetical protein
MDTGKRARLARTTGFICLGLALLNATFAVLAMVDEKDLRSGKGGIAVTASLIVVGIVNLTRSKRRPPPDA